MEAGPISTGQGLSNAKVHHPQKRNQRESKSGGERVGCCDVLRQKVKRCMVLKAANALSALALTRLRNTSIRAFREPKACPFSDSSGVVPLTTSIYSCYSIPQTGFSGSAGSRIIDVAFPSLHAATQKECNS